METRSYTLRGDSEQMFRALANGLPAGAHVSGNSSAGAVHALGSQIVSFSRVGNQLSVTVHRGIAFYSESAIWKKIVDALRPYL
jgi:hypothetical protein